MKTIYIKLSLLLLAFCMTVGVSGQSMRTNSNSKEPAREVIRKLSNNTFEKPSAGVVSYKVGNNKLWALFSGIPEDEPRGSYKTTADRISFYNKYDDIVGFYTPSEGRFYSVSGSGELFEKESSAGVLLDSILYMVDMEGKSYSLIVDENISVEIIGFYLFIL